MKKTSQHFLTLAQKQQISTYTENFIYTMFEEKLVDKTHLLEKAVRYMKNDQIAELITKQTIFKGCFSRLTWQKGLMLQKSNVMENVTTRYYKEVSDVRFLTEVQIADQIAKTTLLIKKIEFNSENPNIAIATANGGNKFKDVTLHLQTSQADLQTMTWDIKAGDNANSVFKGTISVIPLKENNQPYAVLNTPLDLRILQKKRIQYLNDVENTEIWKIYGPKITDIMQLPSDIIVINNLIQEQMLHCFISNLLKHQPSLFAAHKISPTEFNEKYFKKLETHITPRIFDNKESFNAFMKQALMEYNTTIKDISKNIKSAFWKGTGFEQLADDIFK